LAEAELSLRAEVGEKKQHSEVGMNKEIHFPSIWTKITFLIFGGFMRSDDFDENYDDNLQDEEFEDSPDPEPPDYFDDLASDFLENHEDNDNNDDDDELEDSPEYESSDFDDDLKNDLQHSSDKSHCDTDDSISSMTDENDSNKAMDEKKEKLFILLSSLIF
jgi:hypothetical protein